MSFLSKLFGQPHQQSRVRQHGTSRIQYDEHLLQISELSFFGSYSRSLDGRYVIAWRDGTDDGSRGGARDSGSGRYILLYDDAIVTMGRLERPNDGKVANNGVFVLNDWMFSTDLSGTFYAFSPGGEKILHRHFNANLYNNGLANDGQFAVCQTCNSNDKIDSSLLSVFDLKARCELARWRPESGWADSYEFSGHDARLNLVYRSGEKLAYSLHGDFLARRAWIDAALARGDVNMVKRVLQEAGDKPSAELVSSLVASLDVGLNSTPSRDSRTNTLALVLKGKCFDLLGNYEAALQSFESALRLDPKAGVKRRSEQLRKTLSK